MRKKRNTFQMDCLLLLESVSFSLSLFFFSLVFFQLTNPFSSSRFNDEERKKRTAIDMIHESDQERRETERERKDAPLAFFFSHIYLLTTNQLTSMYSGLCKSHHFY